MILADAIAGDAIFACDDCDTLVYSARGEIPQIAGWLISRSICLCAGCRAAVRVDAEELDALAAARKLITALEQRRATGGTR